MEAAALALQRALSRGGRPGPDADFVSDAVVSRSDEVGGRGLFSTRALDVGEELLRVAHAALITAKVGQATAEGGALKRAADEVEDGGEWPAGVVIEPAPGEAVADFPNEETYIVLALVVEDAVRRNASPARDAEVAAILERTESFTRDEGLVTRSDEEAERARRQLYYSALPTLEELKTFHPIFLVPEDCPPEAELPPIPAAVHTAVAGAGLAADSTAAEGYWRAVVAMRGTVLSEFEALAAILGEGFGERHSAEEWLYCWVMVMSRNFLLQFVRRPTPPPPTPLSATTPTRSSMTLACLNRAGRTCSAASSSRV